MSTRIEDIVSHMQTEIESITDASDETVVFERSFEAGPLEKLQLGDDPWGFNRTFEIRLGGTSVGPITMQGTMGQIRDHIRVRVAYVRLDDESGMQDVELMAASDYDRIVRQLVWPTTTWYVAGTSLLDIDPSSRGAPTQVEESQLYICETGFEILYNSP